ncbi:hypothetical protein Anas_07923 [Armadillidium nasatum]|uniref:C2H2-type domain-containing protein n=1 Tax=Armadillidium nasatum TaxID=96803 RepID=A0A5N5TLN7_9CRUS|nr:hypothetical protein Anas_07923 [Armadillidium nasatum]
MDMRSPEIVMVIFTIYNYVSLYFDYLIFEFPEERSSFTAPKGNLNRQNSNTTEFPQRISSTSRTTSDISKMASSNYPFDVLQSKLTTSNSRPLFCKLCKLEYKSLLGLKLHQQMHANIQTVQLSKLFIQEFQKTGSLLSFSNSHWRKTVLVSILFPNIFCYVKHESTY